MFKKPFTPRTTTVLRQSSLRTLRKELSTLYSLTPEVALLLLPEGVLVQKALTHLGDHVTLYLYGSDDEESGANGERKGGKERTICWRKGKEGDGGLLVPSIYALDLVPAMLVEGGAGSVITVEPVLERLISGSALFTAGVQCQFAHLALKANTNDLVSIISSLPTPTSSLATQPVQAIGYLAAPRKELLRRLAGEGSGNGKEEGTAVVTLHARGDYLWLAGGGGMWEPIVASGKGVGQEVEEELEELKIDEPVLPPISLPTPPASSADDSAPPTPTEIDQIFYLALLHYLFSVLQKTPAQLPLPASTIYSSLLPLRPAYISTNLSAWEIKKSGYKKLQGIFRDANKRGLVGTKEMKGVLVVTSVDWKHKDFASLRPYKTLADLQKQTLANAPADPTNPTSENPSSSKSTCITITECLSPLAALRPLLLSPTLSSPTHPLTPPPNNLYSPSDLKKTFNLYLVQNSLIHPKDGTYFYLDELLRESLLGRGEKEGLVGGKEGLMGRLEAGERLEKGCERFWEFKRGNGEGVLRKGSPPLIKIAIKTVGKRMVTLVSNYEGWNLFTGEELADELRVLAAASTSVQAKSNVSAKKPQYEILIQGSVETIVTKLLVVKGIPKKYIVVDSSKGKR